MGLIKAGIGALGGTLADQWKEFFYCESIPKEVLVTKGQKRITGRSSNTKGNDNIISNGSGIAVADGQCMIIVEQGKVVEFCAEPGEFTWDNSTEPSIFAGSLGESIKETFKLVGKRFTYGGDTGKDQRVYYFNMKEIIDNKFGTANPVPFRVVDSKIGLDIDVSIRCAGVYSYKISDPMLFYKNVCGNVESDYERSELDSMLKSEFISALQPAFGKLSDLELRPNQIVSHNTDLENAMNESLSEKVEIASQLDATGIRIEARNKKGREARKVKDVKKFAISFNISRNVTTSTGLRSIYLRISTPMGSVLTSGGTFQYENRQLEYSIRKDIEYTGEEQSVTVYWDVNETLSTGTYRVDIFADGQNIGTASYTINK